ncbi:MAG TPA: fibronectin type III domain-containing protein, partial [Dermatophilaceae bacterium]
TETQDRIFLEAETTDVKTPVDIYMMDVNPLTGAVRNRWATPFEMTGEQNGPLQADGVTPIGGGITTQQSGPQPQRARLRATKAPVGLLSQPTRTMRVAVRSLCTPQAPVNDASGNPVLTALDTCLNNTANNVANGLESGQYIAPTFEFIFPENVKPGDLLVPFDFWHLPFLRYGEGSTTASAIGPGVGPLEPTPWSGASATVPGAPVIGAATAADGTATANWTPPTTDGGAGITSYTVTLVDSAGNPAGTQTVAGNVSTATFIGLANGATYQFKVSATNLLGTGPGSALSNLVTVAAPATTTAPVVSLKVPSGPVSTTAVPVALNWTGTNATAYELQQSVGGAAFADIAGCTSAAPCAGTSVTLSVKPSPTNGAVTTYRYQVRATNPAGTFGAYTAGPTFSVPATDNTGGFSFNGGWGGVNVAGAYNGSVHESSTAGAFAQNSTALAGATVAWVSTLGPDRGMATVSVDGGPATTVDLYSATLKPATVVWQATNLGTVTGHTIRVTVLSTRNAASTGNKVDIDAYLGLK